MCEHEMDDGEHISLSQNHPSLVSTLPTSFNLRSRLPGSCSKNSPEFMGNGSASTKREEAERKEYWSHIEDDIYIQNEEEEKINQVEATNLITRNNCVDNRSWKRVRNNYNLVDFHSLPNYLQDNEFILKYYRANWPLKQTLLSIFSIHNETLNIWTHLIGFLFFLGLTIYTILKLPRVVELPRYFTKIPSFESITRFTKLHFTLSFPYVSQLHMLLRFLKCFLLGSLANFSTEYCISNPTSRWPFFVFLGGVMVCLLTSSTCHLLSCHSQRLSTLLWKLDYAGIATMIVTSYFPPIYYTFLCKPFWRYFYLISITMLGVLTVCISLVPIFQTPGFRSVRALLFFGMGLSGIVPGAHKIVTYWNDPMCFNTLGHEMTMGGFYVVGTLFYTTRIPERWKPGWFDIAGHSHQIFHILVIAGAYTHYKAGLVYLEWRDSHGCDN